MTKAERALQIWQVLISAAHNRQLLTYEIVSDLIGVGKKGTGAIAIRRYLGILMHYCASNNLPPLTALVVRKGLGRPGSGLTTLGSNPDKKREAVFHYEWFKLPPLSVEQLDVLRK